MSHTNSTSHYSLPQFVGTDIPTWLGDFNSAMTTIDNGINSAATTAGSASTTAAQASTDAAAAQAAANSAISSAASASQAASDAAAAVTAEQERAEAAETAITNSIPSTTVNMTLYAETWNNGSYTITNDLITSTSNQEIVTAVGITADQYNALSAAIIVDGGQSAGSLTLKALGTVPTIDVPIRIIFRGVK
jgi:hypothetical protein